VAHEYEFREAVSIEDADDLGDQVILALNRASDAEADGHKFYGKDTNVAIGTGRVVVYRSQEIDIRVETYADTVNEYKREARPGGVWAVPIAQSRRRGDM
jgi:hypothetical protein